MTPPPPNLDDQIQDVFSVVSLLLAVAAAYFAAIWPIIHDLLQADETRMDEFERGQLAGRCRAYAWASIVLAAVSVCIVGTMSTLAWDTVQQWSPDADFHPIRAALAMALVLLVVTAIAGVKLFYKLRSRATELEG